MSAQLLMECNVEDGEWLVANFYSHIRHTPDLLTPLLSHRCRVIPFVSRTFHRVHKAHSPKAWCIQKPITKAVHKYFRTIASSLEKLTVEDSLTKPPKPPGFLLEMLAFHAPRLQDLELHYRYYVFERIPVVPALVALSQIKKLTLAGWCIKNEGKNGRLESFACLRSLEVNCLIPFRLYQPYTDSSG